MRIKYLILTLIFLFTSACIHQAPRLPAQATESSFQGYLESQKNRGGMANYAAIYQNARALALQSKKYQEEYRLSDAEFVSIFEYTSIFCKDVNTALWHNEGIELHEPFIQMLKSALVKVPDYSGMTYRGVSLSADEKKSYVVGEIKTFPAFTSTSAVENRYMLRESYSIMEFVSKHGKKIEMFSLIPSEHEVLFNAGTKFRVFYVNDEMRPASLYDASTGIWKMGQEMKTVIKLEELD